MTVLPDHIHLCLCGTGYNKKAFLSCPQCGKPQQIPYADNNPDRSLQNTVVECQPSPALGEAAEGEETLLGSVLVRFTGYRVRPLDPDNFAGSTKNAVDFIRRVGLISGDEPWTITLQTSQVRVRSFKEEKTVIEVIYPDAP